jgi:hypothetical protein
MDHVATNRIGVAILLVSTASVRMDGNLRLAVNEGKFRFPKLQQLVADPLGAWKRSPRGDLKSQI